MYGQFMYKLWTIHGKIQGHLWKKYGQFTEQDLENLLKIMRYTFGNPQIINIWGMGQVEPLKQKTNRTHNDNRDGSKSYKITIV